MILNLTPTERVIFLLIVGGSVWLTYWLIGEIVVLFGKVVGLL